jgi:hypothetical protein
MEPGSSATRSPEGTQMTDGERRLAKVLVGVLVAAFLFTTTAIGVERITEARSRVADYERRIARLSSVDVDEEGLHSRLRSLDASIGRAEERARAASIASISDFGREVKRLLTLNGLAPLKYQSVSGSHGEELELSLRCAIGSFLGFLRSATSEKEDWRVRYLSLHMMTDGSQAEIVVRLSR